MKFRGLGLLLGTLLGPAGGAWAAETASFLAITPGARPIAMGEAFTAVADDLNALSWNPAGLSSLTSREASFMHAELFAGTRYDYVGYAHPLSRTAGTGEIHPTQDALAFSVARVSQDSFGGRAGDRSPSGDVTASDMAFQAAYSRPFYHHGPSFGVAIKVLQSELGGEKARGYAVDLGVKRVTRAAGRPVMLGASVLNAGPGLRFIDERNDLPLAVSLGAAVRATGAFLLSADLRHRPHSGRTVFTVGSEYAVVPSFTLRAGYGAQFAADGGPVGEGPAAALSGMGMGMGVRLGIARLDYSFAPAGELGTTQRVSLTTRF